MISWICARLRHQFDRYLVDTADYRERVMAECRAFPEGDLFPYVFPVCGYANIAIANPTQSAHAREQILKLINLAIPSVTQLVKPPSGALDKLVNYQDHAVYLGQLNIALGYYRLIGGDDRFEPIHERVTHTLHDALVATDYKPLWSYPHASWPFDTVPCLLSLKLRDHCQGTNQYGHAIEQHLQWVRKNATDPQTGLPYSQLDSMGAADHELPRGCDISLRLMLMPYLDAQYADVLYQNYISKYWRRLGPCGGFSEWPRGIDKFSDMDSGPIFLGIGMAATGFGVGSASAMGDVRRERLFSAELRLARASVLVATNVTRIMNIFTKNFSPSGVNFSPEYFTGFLFGDVCLFHAASWHPWPSVSSTL